MILTNLINKIKHFCRINNKDSRIENINTNKIYKVDIVIPFVNGLDIKWQEIYKQYSNNIDFERFDGHDILKYVFRSIDKNVNWINNVYLIVMQESQIPSWINRENVKIVFHNEFIPKKHLPVFNSTAIEMYLWNIPGLSERFIYINDDIIFNNPVSFEHYFDVNGDPLVTMRYTKYTDENSKTIYAQQFIGSCNLAAEGTSYTPYDEYNYILFRPGHGANAYKKSWLKQIYRKFKDKIEASISKFREPFNFNQYLLSSYMYFHQLSKLKAPIYKYIGVKHEHKPLIKKSLFNTSVLELCLNDISLTTVNDKIWLKHILLQKFLHKCKYEI